MAEEIKRAICGFCTEHHWIPFIVRDGKLVGMARVNAKGKPTDRVIAGCPRAHAIPEFYYHPDRLNYPLKRAGERGENKWQRITWDQALDEIADKLKIVRDKYGPEGLAITSVGEGCCPEEYRRRFQFQFGTPNFFSHGQVCTSAVGMLSHLMLGNMIYFASIRPETKCILLLGKNPAASAIRYWHHIIEAQDRGAKLIVVDPRGHDAALRADVWLKVKPGTDAALCLGMMRVIINEGLYDKDFVQKWCYGFDKLAERVQDYPLEKVEKITEVPADKIREAAIMYATNKPALIDHGMGYEESVRNTQAYLCKILLSAITGNTDQPGGDYLPLSNPHISPLVEVESVEKLTRSQRDKTLGQVGGLYKVMNQDTWEELVKNVKKVRERPFSSLWLSEQANAPIVFRAMVSGKPYPVKALIEVATNTLVNYPNTHLVYKALKNLDLLVCMELFMTPSCMMADYVLPAASFLEKSYLRGGDYLEYFHGHEPLFPPQYERKPEYDFWCGLGLKLGQDWPWKTAEEAFDYRLRPWGITFHEFVARGGNDFFPQQYLKHEKVGFGTPTGKIELYPTWLEKLGLDPLPKYEGLPEKCRTTEEYPLILLNGSRNRNYYHSQGRQWKFLRKRSPEPLMQMNPSKAAELGINDGDWVWIETRLGRVKFKCQYFKHIDPGVIEAENGWWYPEDPGEEPSLFGLWRSNISVLLDDDPEICDPYTGEWPLRGQACKVYKAE